MSEEQLLAYLCDVVFRGGVQAAFQRVFGPAAVAAPSCPPVDLSQCVCPERRAVELTVLAALVVLALPSLFAFGLGVLVGKLLPRKEAAPPVSGPGQASPVVAPGRARIRHSWQNSALLGTSDGLDRGSGEF